MLVFVGALLSTANTSISKTSMLDDDFRGLLHLLLQQIPPFSGQGTWGFGATQKSQRDDEIMVFINAFHDQDHKRKKQQIINSIKSLMFKMSLIQDLENNNWI